MDEFKEFQDLISNINIESKYIILVFIVIFVFIIEFILLKKGVIDFTVNKRKMRKAINLNHTIKAYRISYFDDGIPRYTRTNSWYHAKYEYKINGEKRIYRYLSKQFPSSEITLYYINNPRRLFNYDGRISRFAVLIYIIPFAVAIVLMNLLGIK